MLTIRVCLVSYRQKLPQLGPPPTPPGLKLEFLEG